MIKVRAFSQDGTWENRQFSMAYTEEEPIGIDVIIVLVFMVALIIYFIVNIIKIWRR